MEDLQLIEYLNSKSLRSERIFKDRYNPFESLNDIDYIELYRLRKESVVEFYPLVFVLIQLQIDNLFRQRFNYARR